MCNIVTWLDHWNKTIGNYDLSEISVTCMSSCILCEMGPRPRAVVWLWLHCVSAVGLLMLWFGYDPWSWDFKGSLVVSSIWVWAAGLQFARFRLGRPLEHRSITPKLITPTAPSCIDNSCLQLLSIHDGAVGVTNMGMMLLYSGVILDHIYHGILYFKKLSQGPIFMFAL